MKYTLAVMAMLMTTVLSVMVAHAQIDVESLGKPLGPDDSVPMVDRYVYFDEGEATKNAPLNLPVISHEESWILLIWRFQMRLPCPIVIISSVYPKLKSISLKPVWVITLPW